MAYLPIKSYITEKSYWPLIKDPKYKKIPGRERKNTIWENYWFREKKTSGEKVYNKHFGQK